MMSTQMTRARRLILTLVAVMAAATSCTSVQSGNLADDPDLPLGDAIERRQTGPPALRVLSPEPGGPTTSPVRVEVTVDNYVLAAKGVSRDGEGHFHVIVDGSCIEPGEVIGDEHLHVGNGASFIDVELDPGVHQLCLQLGDGFHTALAITETLTVDVVE